MTREQLPPRRAHITQKVKIGANRTLYLSVDSETDPKEIFLRIKGDADAEKVAAYDSIARLVSVARQYGVPFDALGNALHGIRDETAGPVQPATTIRFCGGTLDYIGTHFLVHFAGRNDLSHRELPDHLGGPHEQKETRESTEHRTPGLGDAKSPDSAD